MSFIVHCHFCSQKIECEDSDNGTFAPCPKCGKTFLVKNTATIVDEVQKREEINDSGKEHQYRQPEYKTPVLSEVFTLNFIFHLISAFIALMCTIYHFDKGNTHLAWGSVAWLIAAISAAVLCYGISEFFRFIGRISDNSDAIREFVEKTYYKK